MAFCWLLLDENCCQNEFSRAFAGQIASIFVEPHGLGDGPRHNGEYFRILYTPAGRYDCVQGKQDLRNDGKCYLLADHDSWGMMVWTLRLATVLDMHHGHQEADESLTASKFRKCRWLINHEN